ncbi:MAG: AraC family transcriptional regulator [Rhodobacteraceae bacterium]|jgi:AraC-like DNA-binding protein|nr:AraC family transcriptional regulator [Paracoccaceae bacterium]
MSTPVAVLHGAFGRVCLYDMDRAMVVHAHREGHLIFHVQGPAAEVVVDERRYPLGPGQAVAISPWQPHFYRPERAATNTLALVLYIKPVWFIEAARSATSSLRFGRVGIEVAAPIARRIAHVARTMLAEIVTDQSVQGALAELTQACFDQSWQWTAEGGAFLGRVPQAWDFRIRRSLNLMREWLGEDFGLDEIARESGLSRPHFYKLFRETMGLTPNIYLNALRMEHAIERLSSTHDPVADIGLDLGFASQSSFSRFFIANGVVAPSDYRRSVLVARPRA